MKTRVLACLLILALTPALPGQAAQIESDGWENVGPGVDYKLFIVGSVQAPIRAHVARMDRSNQEVIIESSIAGGRLARNNETTSAMGRRYDGAINFWGESWGNTNKVIVAINGFYVENTNWVTPQSGQIHSGWYSKRFVAPNGDMISNSGFAWKLSREAFIGDCVLHYPHKQVVNFPTTEKELFITGTNIARPDDSLILYTPQYDTRTPSTGIEVEVLVEMSRPLLVIPPSRFVGGIVREIRQGDLPFIIPFDHIVISGRGSAAAALLEAAQVGEEVRISQEITNYVGEACQINPLNNWDKTYTSIGGQFIFIQNGEVRNVDPTNHVHPRTAVAYNDNYIYFIVVDGRAPGYSVGMSILQLGNFARDYLQASWGIAEDGGGSSTMVINDVVVNRPSDPCNNFIFLPQVGKDTWSTPPPEIYDPDRGFHQYTGACERRTGNGLLMVAVQKAEFSNTFIPSSQMVVETHGTTNVRLGPGSNYAAIGSVPAGTVGVLLENKMENKPELQGVYAKGHYWWKVNFENGTVGWVIEDALENVTSPMVLWRYLR